MKRTLRTALLIVIAIAAALAGYFVNPGTRTPQIDVDMLLAASLPDPAGTRQRVGDWRGRVTVINFWATWCPPCLEEIPEFVRLQEALRARGVRFLGIAIDDPARVQQFAASARINYSLLTGQAEAMELSRHAGNRRGALPYTLVLDPQGKVIGRYEGVVPIEELQELLEQASG